jgi:hypothetical protein
MNLFGNNWLHIGLYLLKLSPLAVMSQFKHITFITYLILLGVRTQLSMVESNDDEVVIYVNSDRGFRIVSIVQHVDCLTSISDTDMEE